MTQEKFIKVLDEKGYSYKIVGDRIIVTHKGNVYLDSLKTLPPGVEFKNEGNVYLRALETIPPGVEFKNGGDVYLESLETLPPGVVFKNEGDVKLGLLMGNYVVWFKNWEGNIKGVDSKRLLNVMIKQGVFI